MPELSDEKLKLRPMQISEICRFAMLSDREIRSDLVHGYITDENDYTSNFTGAFRRYINSHSQNGLSATSYRLPISDERVMGCDATIIISSNSCCKVAIFEAKYPRVSQHQRWDYRQTASGLSHFSDQLERQKIFSDRAAIFEMFYCEFPFGEQPDFMADYGSTCVWHDEAVSHNLRRENTENIWSSNDLKKMFANGYHTIDTILRDVCLCEKGRLLPDILPESISDFLLPLQGEVLRIEASNAN